MSATGNALSTGLQALVDNFAEFEHAGEVSMAQEDLLTLLSVLRTMQGLATNLEIEVRCLRDVEASGQVHGAVESEATDQLSDMLGELESKVIRPTFGRKP